ncbi:hypothetical protein P4C99_21705 [Pontiellaceae bacterium B1224]|nr:hypothetical protein [Pontiellaceae bacterium B1224]
MTAVTTDSNSSTVTTRFSRIVVELNDVLLSFAEPFAKNPCSTIGKGAQLTVHKGGDPIMLFDIQADASEENRQGNKQEFNARRN